jgi:ribosomal protein S17
MSEYFSRITRSRVGFTSKVNSFWRHKVKRTRMPRLAKVARQTSGHTVWRAKFTVSAELSVRQVGDTEAGMGGGVENSFCRQLSKGTKNWKRGVAEDAEDFLWRLLCDRCSSAFQKNPSNKPVKTNCKHIG